MDIITTSMETTIAGLANESILPVGETLYATGNAISSNGNSIILQQPGKYAIAATFTIEPSAADFLTVIAMINGLVITDANASICAKGTIMMPMIFNVGSSIPGSEISFRLETTEKDTSVKLFSVSVDVVMISCG